MRPGCSAPDTINIDETARGVGQKRITCAASDSMAGVKAKREHTSLGPGRNGFTAGLSVVAKQVAGKRVVLVEVSDPVKI